MTLLAVSFVLRRVKMVSSESLNFLNNNRQMSTHYCGTQFVKNK